VVVMSIAEGEDKPLKYPNMFRASGVMILNKIDLLPHVEFDVAECVANARAVNPAIEIFELSALRGDGLDH
jgi:hydrogenase nickel incorporation protein HypB